MTQLYMPIILAAMAVAVILRRRWKREVFASKLGKRRLLEVRLVAAHISQHDDRYLP